MGERSSRVRHFDQARHADELQAQMAGSAFAALLEPAAAELPNDNVVPLSSRPAKGRRPSARERAALRWAT